MRICVLGLWHLGCVTAACLAKLGHQVVGLDFDARTIEQLNRGTAPVLEAGLQELIQRGLASGNLHFTADASAAARDADILWVAYDTPISENDSADPEFVMSQVQRALAEAGTKALVLISSQLPVGSARRLEGIAAAQGAFQISVACCPENLRLGQAVNDFMHPDRIVAGVRSENDKRVLHALLSTITESIEWMTVESAEMTKHAINTFLAASVVFANEMASICELVGADAKQVERGMKSERRIGVRAYLAPGAAFAGGTLGRDVAYLNESARERGITVPLLASISASNAAHRNWPRNKLRTLFSDLSQTTLVLWGLTYKPGTDTLRQSPSVQLGDWMLGEGATLRVHDPMVQNLPDHWRARVNRFEDPLAAVHGAHALIIVTEWPMYRSVSSEQLVQCSRDLVVLDANRFLPHLASATDALRYFAVGSPQEAS